MLVASSPGAQVLQLQFHLFQWPIGLKRSDRENNGASVGLYRHFIHAGGKQPASFASSLLPGVELGRFELLRLSRLADGRESAQGAVEQARAVAQA